MEINQIVLRRLRKSLKESAFVHDLLARGFLEPLIIDVAKQACETLNRGGKIFFFGNGGSAADAQHLAAEFVGRFGCERPALPAIALTTDSSLLTAVGNDFGFQHVFSRQIEALAHKGDLAVGISTSGNSANVVEGMRAAHAQNVKTVALTGSRGGALGELADICVRIPSYSTARIQEAHITIGHLICEAVEEILFPTAAELNCFESDAVCPPECKVVTWDTLLRLREKWREIGVSVVWTTVCPDVLHSEIFFNMSKARGLGDILIVGVSNDCEVDRLVDRGRSSVPENEALRLIAALEGVSVAIDLAGTSTEAALRKLRPDVYCQFVTDRRVDSGLSSESSVVESYGGSVNLLTLSDLSDGGIFTTADQTQDSSK